MKKFLAGALAAVLALSNSAPAFAAEEKNLTKQGEISYEIAAKSPKIVLNVVLPSQLKAALNPYGNDFELDETGMIHSQSGIVSVAYPIHNYNTDYGFFLDATAVTSTSSDKWAITKNPLTPGVKGANMAFTASDTADGIPVYSNVSKAATSKTSQGNLPLDSTVPANSVKGTEKGQTSQKKVAYVPASADGEVPNIIYVGFAGKLADDSDTVYVDWSENDIISVRLILKLTPAPKNLETPPDP